MKTKNTYSKLRRINKALKDKIDTANRALNIVELENKELKKAIHIKDIIINSLEIKEKELSDKINSLCNNAIEQNKLNNDNYEAWLYEHELNSKLSVGLTVVSIVAVGLVFALFGVAG